MHQGYPLTKNYVIFGQIIEGFDVLDTIANTKVENNAMGEMSKPTEEIIVKSIEIIEK